jgi:hypothetical protein
MKGLGRKEVGRGKDRKTVPLYDGGGGGEAAVPISHHAGGSVAPFYHHHEMVSIDSAAEKLESNHSVSPKGQATKRKKATTVMTATAGSAAAGVSASSSASPSSSSTTVEPYEESALEASLHAADVRNLAFVLRVFAKFDVTKDHLVSVTELRIGLRSLGRYYSSRQTCDIVESFRRRNGSSLHKEPLLSKGDFVRLLLLHGSGEFEPLDDFGAESVTKGPSVVVDVVARWVYPLMYVGKCVYFYYALVKY